MKIINNRHGYININTILAACILTFVLSVILSPILRPYFQASEAEHKKRIFDSAVQIEEVTITKKDILAVEKRGQFGRISYTDKKYFVFELNSEEYYVTAKEEQFFNNIKKDDTITIYRTKDNQLGGKTSDGTKSLLSRY